jgi:DNA-binding MarR family transcriptional regulator
MTLSQRRVLRRLRDGARSAGDLAASLGISPPSLTRQLAKLEERGLIVRELDTVDRRRVLVELTPRGQRALVDHRVFAGSALARASQGLTPAQGRRLVENLDALVHLARDLQGGDPDE